MNELLILCCVLVVLSTILILRVLNKILEELEMINDKKKTKRS